MNTYTRKLKNKDESYAAKNKIHEQLSDYCLQYYGILEGL